MRLRYTLIFLPSLNLNLATASSARSSRAASDLYTADREMPSSEHISDASLAQSLTQNRTALLHGFPMDSMILCVTSYSLSLDERGPGHADQFGSRVSNGSGFLMLIVASLTRERYTRSLRPLSVSTTFSTRIRARYSRSPSFL